MLPIWHLCIMRRTKAKRVARASCHSEHPQSSSPSPCPATLSGSWVDLTKAKQIAPRLVNFLFTNQPEGGNPNGGCLRPSAG